MDVNVVLLLVFVRSLTILKNIPQLSKNTKGVCDPGHIMPCFLSLGTLMSSAGRLINWTAKPFIKFNKALFRGSGELVFFSISLMCQSYSAWLCANSYWIFIKTQTNSNRCASGIALKINLLNSTKLPP